MKVLIRNWFAAWILTGVFFIPDFSRAADPPLSIAVTTSNPGPAISANALGLSYETSLMLPDTNGVHYFRPDNKPLVTIFRTLGVKSLRIGGNSVDAAKIRIPETQDISAFFNFARAAGVTVIYTVRLQESTNSAGLPVSTAAGNAESAAKIARLIHDRYADLLDCFAIGNEPNYFKDYAVYAPKWKAIRDAILAVYPEARFCGPDQNPAPELDKKMVRDFGNDSGRLVMITQHSYPFGCSYKNPNAPDDISKLVPFDAGESREKMLSPTAYNTYEKIYGGIAGAIEGSAVSFRLSECNSYWFSGLKGASDSYASALWAVDYLHWWTAHGAAGLNLHTGDRTGGDLSMPCRYAAFVTSKRGYEARPLAYGMKLFDLGGHGQRLPNPEISASNLVAYAAMETNTVFVTLINKSHATGAKAQSIQIKLDRPVNEKSAQIIFLRGKHDDIAGGSGDVTLGGAPILEDSSWKGRWTPLRRSEISNNVITVKMPRASAAVVKVVLAKP